jgi:hypothetical protein
MHKHLQQIVRADGRKAPGKTTRLTGSELLIIRPAVMTRDTEVQLYPFVFETIGDWGASVAIQPPEGFVADFPELSAYVANEGEAVQFTITEIGSGLLPTQTRFDVIHNGQTHAVLSDVDILLTASYARVRGFDVEALRERGLIVEDDSVPPRPIKPAGAGRPQPTASGQEP